MDVEHIAFVSYGNDSIALLQYCIEEGVPDVHALFSDTGWAAPEWMGRVSKAEEWAGDHGIVTHRIPSIGMRELVKRKKGWPRHGMQFCTGELKIQPAIEYMDAIDPDKDAICMVGVRREESASRASWPEWVESSESHGGRSLWSPICRLTERERDELIYRAGWAPLPHRSQECYPCINANKADLRMLTPERIDEIEAFEHILGHTSKGNARTMFRPAKKGGAVGIRAVVDWATDNPGQGEFDFGGGCDSGFCGL